MSPLRLFSPYRHSPCVSYVYSEGDQTGIVPRGPNSWGLFSSSTKAQDNTVALHDAKKIAKREAHLMFPQLGIFITRQGSALDSSFVLLN